jgi:DNA-binding NtrC family response regulator
MRNQQVGEIGHMVSGVVETCILYRCMNEEFNHYSDYYLSLLNSFREKNVLIVEDDFSSSMVLEAKIASIQPKMNILLSCSAQGARDIIDRVRCDYVIADFFLEGEKTGLDLCYEIQRDRPEVQCVIVSKLASYKYQELAQHSRFPPPFIEKPVRVSQLKSFFSSLFNR